MWSGHASVSEAAVAGLRSAGFYLAARQSQHLEEVEAAKKAQTVAAVPVVGSSLGFSNPNFYETVSYENLPVRISQCLGSPFY